MVGLALALAAAGVSGLTLLGRHDSAVSPAAPAQTPRPKLALLTSLPLLFAEEFALEPPRGRAMALVEQHFTVVPIALADIASLRGFDHLLMAHPRAQPAEVLVELDQWVRRGGQVVILADPRLEWESTRPLGDRLRPPPDFADTGLLAHWGLRLGSDGAGNGRLRSTSPNCLVSEEGLVAQCKVGRGRARVIADADFVMGVGGDASARLQLLIRQLSRGDRR